MTFLGGWKIIPGWEGRRGCPRWKRHQRRSSRAVGREEDQACPWRPDPGLRTSRGSFWGGRQWFFSLGNIFFFFAWIGSWSTSCWSRQWWSSILQVEERGTRTLGSPPRRWSSARRTRWLAPGLLLRQKGSKFFLSIFPIFFCSVGRPPSAKRICWLVPRLLFRIKVARQWFS